MPIFSDAFTDTTGTSLTAHIPSTGASWYELFATSANINISSNQAVGSVPAAGQGQTCGAANGPVVNDFEIGFTFTNVHTGTLPHRVRLLARLTSITDYYKAEFLPTGHANNDSAVFKRVSGTQTQLASVDTGLAASDVMLFRITDENKVLYKNGACIISTNDNAITALGLVGLSYGQIDATDAGRISDIWRTDDFVVQELDVICTRSVQQTVYRM